MPRSPPGLDFADGGSALFEELLRGWDGEEVALRYDEPTGAWMFVCVHSTVLGPGMGGTRMNVYPSAHDALADGLRLSGAMTLKQAAADLPYGGGKAVLAVPEIPAGESRRTMLLRYAELVAAMGGTYVTAADMNTGEADMDVIAERCPHVLGQSIENGGAGDSAPNTAVGVFHGILASAQHAFGSDVLAGRTILVLGVGAVGGRLADLLHKAGAKILVADVDQERAASTAWRTDGTVVELDDIFVTDCDVLAPCATGGVLSSDTIPRLRCRIVAGAANNQLATPEDAERLRAAGILYAPDYVINAGGVLHLAGYETLGWTEEEMTRRLVGIGDTLTDVFAQADREGITTEAAAQGVALGRIDSARRA